MAVNSDSKDSFVTSSASDFLRSISAESSVHFGDPTSESNSSSSRRAPDLPISAKVSLIDAQIDNLESQIRQVLQSHRHQLETRASSSRSVHHSLNTLWESVHQTSSNLVAVPLDVSPHAAQYHEALGHSKKQELLISVLSDLVPALKLLEQLEGMVRIQDSAGIRSLLPQVEAIIPPIISQQSFQSLSAVIELQRRFQDVRDQSALLYKTAREPLDTNKALAIFETAEHKIDDTPRPSASASILDTARKLIISKGAENGWKAVVVSSPHDVVTVSPPQPVHEAAPSPEMYPVVPMREDVLRSESPLTRSSSNSSGVASRKQRVKLGARVLRPQDQLGSGPFNAQDTGLDGSDWGLDDDDDLPMNVAGPNSVAMHPSNSNSSLQRATLAIQDGESGDEAWGLEEEPTSEDAQLSSERGSAASFISEAIKSPERPGDDAGAWGLEDDDDDNDNDEQEEEKEQEQEDSDAPVLSQAKLEAVDSESISKVPEKVASPSPAQSYTSAAQHDNDSDDAWGIEDGDDEDASHVAASRTESETATPLVSQHKDGEAWGSDFGAAPALQRPQNTLSPLGSVDDGEDAWELADEPANSVQESRFVAGAPSAVAPIQEKCTISQRSIDLVHLARQTMDEGTRILSLEGDELTSASRPDLILATVGDIFELHRSLMPVAHGEVLRDVPSLAMQFFNDCEYLARELVELVQDKEATVSTAWFRKDAAAAANWQDAGLSKLQEQAMLTRSLGQRWFEAQITAQSKVLIDTLIEADGFARTFDEERFLRCERCIRQTVQTLEQLGKAWRPILTPSHFNPAVGRLVDLVFQKVLHDVLDLEDIGESESEKIGSLIKTLGGLETLFFDAKTQQSSAPLFVPSWFKTSYLIEILTGSLIDIEFLAFEAKALVDYSRKELTGLIKALFSDTNNRSKLLHKIEMAGPDILALRSNYPR